MSFDGAFLFKTIEELKTAIDCHVDKIYQPARDELVFLLRKKNFQKKLLISAKPGTQRIHFTENKYENPATPPMFCMLLRKHLSSARLIKIYAPLLERVAVLVFSSTNEMGDITETSLVCELIGGKANIILIDKNSKIINSLHYSDVETASRLILPGAAYHFPERKEKLNPVNCTAEEILKAAQNSTLISCVDGFSPLICREIENSQNPGETLKRIIADLKNNNNPVMICSPDGEPFEFSYTEIFQYSSKYTTKHFNSFCELLDAFYSEKEITLRINNAAKDILKLVNNAISRTQKKYSLRLNELKKCEDRENLRIYGELIKANLYNIKKGSSFAEVPNYYSENMEIVRIPLDISLSAKNNADRYFKEYKKTYTAEQVLKELTKKDCEELLYLDSVLDSIERSRTLADIAQIREELIDAGYIKQPAVKKKSNGVTNQFKEYTSKEGYKIIVGKNNKQNDYITTVLAGKNDLWFHAKNIAGSHVVVFCDNKEVCHETILQAATLAALNSKANHSSNVAVDYTPIKFVKKPNGAKAGMVIYKTNKTVYVTPKGDD